MGIKLHGPSLHESLYVELEKKIPRDKNEYDFTLISKKRTSTPRGPPSKKMRSAPDLVNLNFQAKKTTGGRERLQERLNYDTLVAQFERFICRW